MLIRPRFALLVLVDSLDRKIAPKLEFHVTPKNCLTNRM